MNTSSSSSPSDGGPKTAADRLRAARLQRFGGGEERDSIEGGLLHSEDVIPNVGVAAPTGKVSILLCGGIATEDSVLRSDISPCTTTKTLSTSERLQNHQESRGIIAAVIAFTNNGILDGTVAAFKRKANVNKNHKDLKNSTMTRRQTMSRRRRTGIHETKRSVPKVTGNYQ